jgi:hypothetical protein
MTQNMLNKEENSILSRIYGIFIEEFDSRITDNTSSNNYYTVGDLIILLIYVYSLIGEDCFHGIEEEDRIKVKFHF